MEKSIQSWLLALTLLLSFGGGMSAQTLSNYSEGRPNILDGAYVPETNWLKRVIPYPDIREADVFYKKRIWQEIDLNQKFNHPYYFPTTPNHDRQNLFDVIREALTSSNELWDAYYAGELGNDDEFNTKLTPAQIEETFFETVENFTYDDNGDILDTLPATRVPIESKDITRYRLKEEWIWDRQRSERYVRIIGIAPMKERNENGEISFKPLFWLYYPEWRHVFARASAYNTFNDAQRRTYLDLFEKRYFTSYIIKEDNAFDRPIASYARGMDALAESERIKELLFNMEHDMWHY
jgi:gliding motility associated protien GldN